MSDKPASPRIRWRKAWMATDLPASTKLVLHTLVEHMNAAGHCWPSVALVAKEASLSRRVVILHLHSAKEAGWIEIASAGKSGQGWARHGYRIRYPQGAEGGDQASLPFEEKVVTEDNRLAPCCSGEGGDVDDTKAVTFQHEGGYAASPEPVQGTSPRNQPNRGAARKRSRRSPETPLPEVWREAAHVPDDLAEIATAKGLTREQAQHEFESFCAHAERNDRRCRKWPAAWRGWVLKSLEFTHAQGNRTGKAGGGRKDMAALGRVAARMSEDR